MTLFVITHVGNHFVAANNTSQETQATNENQLFPQLEFKGQHAAILFLTRVSGILNCVSRIKDIRHNNTQINQNEHTPNITWENSFKESLWKLYACSFDYSKLVSKFQQI